MVKFALVRFKCNAKVGVVRVAGIRRVVKEKGAKTFVPYEPVNNADFIVSKKFNYVVHIADEEGNIRMWYIMIGRLGASAEAVLNGFVPWPNSRFFSRLPDESEETCTTLKVSSPSASREIHQDLKNLNNAPVAFLEQSLTKSDLEKNPTQAESDEEARKPCQQCNEQNGQMTEKTHLILEQVGVFVSRLETFFDFVVKRVNVLEKSVAELQRKIKDDAHMAHVSEWVNSIPVSKPDDEAMSGISDANPVVISDTKLEVMSKARSDIIIATKLNLDPDQVAGTLTDRTLGVLSEDIKKDQIITEDMGNEVLSEDIKKDQIITEDMGNEVLSEDMGKDEVTSEDTDDRVSEDVGND